MKQVPLREFQLKPSLYLSSLPIMLTRHGKPVAMVVTSEEDSNIPVEENAESILHAETEQERMDRKYEEYLKTQGGGGEIKKGLPEKSEVREKVWTDYSRDDVMALISEGWCQGHFETVKGKTFKRYLISIEDPNGNIKVEKKWYCDACLLRARNEIDISGGVIIGS